MRSSAVRETVTPIPSSSDSSFRSASLPSAVTWAISARTTTPRLTASPSARFSLGWVSLKTYKSRDVSARSMASSTGPTPSSGCTSSFMGSGLLFFCGFELDCHLLFGIERENRGRHPIGSLPSGKGDVVGQLVLAGCAQLVAKVLFSQELLDLGFDVGGGGALDLELEHLDWRGLDRLQRPQHDEN